VQKRVVIDLTETPDGDSLELAIEHGHHIIRVGGVPLMSSEMSGSEEAMAEVAREELGPIEGPRILIGGLGMGFTLRATLDAFDEHAEVCVAELMHHIVHYNRFFLGDLADRPLEDPRVDVFEGDVKKKLAEGDWDAILMDVDNGPDALTAQSNQNFYNARGVDLMARALAPGGVLVVWSAYSSPRFLERLRHTGLSARAETVRARWPISKGPMHTLFIATKPER
jgi:spermidine synthase